MKSLLPTLIVLMLFSSPLRSEPQDLFLWRHNANDYEIKTSFDAIERFNKSQNQWRVTPDLINEESYTQSINAAAQANMLPCIIEVDQPLVPSFASKGYISPLTRYLDSSFLSSINRSGKGTYQNEVYSLGPNDVSLALFTRKSLLTKIGVRIPTIEQPWDKNEFMEVLNKVKETDKYKYQYPLDMRAHDMTEWIPYAWAPLMLSWGADLIDRSDFQTVDGFVNSEKAIQFGKWIQYLVHEKYMDPRPEQNDGFINGDVAIQYGGSWSLTEYYDAFDEDLAILPVPDFGNGSFIGGGGWHWAMSESCQHREGAIALLSFLMSAEEQVAMSRVPGIFPTQEDAARMTGDYSENGRWRIFYNFSNKFAKMRPETPTYPVISASYKKAMRDILNGMPPSLALNLAAESIKSAIERQNLNQK